VTAATLVLVLHLYMAVNWLIKNYCDTVCSYWQKHQNDQLQQVMLHCI